MRVFVADDSVLFREGLARVLGEAGFEVIAQAANAEELYDHLDREPADFAIVDIRMPPTHTNEGLVAAQRIRERHPRTAVLVLSQYVEAHYAMKLLSTGATSMGYLLKDRVLDLAQFTDVVRRVGSGELLIDPAVISQLLDRQRAHNPLDQLTDRERDVLTLIAQGRSNQSISQTLFLSPKTVEAHVRNIFAKFGLPPTADDHRRVLAVLTFLRSETTSAG
ncbi:MAG: response regulator transcription factor [Actinomycetota bacterium]|nr:response regulator transcription factor [Actinomycetota bacterium]